jgi:predicted nucleic acid-binding protein
VNGYLLDTVVLSATRLPRRNPEVERWMGHHQTDPIFIPVFALGEIQQGIEVAPNPALQGVLADWLADLRETYRDWILPFRAPEALVWGALVAPLELAGRSPAAVDAMIAATALTHDLGVVTRNVRHFQTFDVEIINPWDDENGAVRPRSRT